ncbi:MAG: hypothetical protein AAGB22_03020, partial [Bacteroidota bacterium]
MWSRLSFWHCTLVALIAFTVIAYRAATIGFTHDEAYTYNHYVTAPLAAVMQYDNPTANNHLLNTVLMQA